MKTNLFTTRTEDSVGMATMDQPSHMVIEVTREGVDTRTKDLTGAMADIDIESGLPAVHLGTCLYCCEEMRMIGEELCADCFWDWKALQKAPFRCWQKGDRVGQMKAEEELMKMEEVIRENREDFGLLCVCCSGSYCVGLDEHTQNGYCSQECQEEGEAVLYSEEEMAEAHPTCRTCGRCCEGSDYEAERLCSRRCMVREFYKYD